MALKDWKAKPYQKDAWYKKNDSVEIIENYNASGNLDYYTVEVFLFETKDDLAKWLNSRKFSKRSLALKHAKDYMRTH